MGTQHFRTFSIKWLVRRRVAQIIFYNDMTLRDIQELNRMALEFLKNSDGPMFFITDVSRDTQIEIGPFSAKKELSYLQHPNVGEVQLVGANPYMHFFGKVMCNLADAPVRHHATWDEAIAYVRTLAPEIPAFEYVPSQTRDEATFNEQVD